MTIEELRARLLEIRERLEALRADAETRALNDDETGEIDALMGEFDEKRDELTKLEERAARLEQIRQADLGDPSRTESGDGANHARFNTNAGRGTEDVYDLDGYRSRAGSEDELRGLYRDGAMKAVERAVFPDARVNREDAQERIERLLQTVNQPERLSQLLIATGSQEYRDAFGKAISGRHLTNEEARLLERAASLTDANGGYAVPFALDPTVILTSDGAVNPYRQIARVVTITTNQWNGVSSAGITAAYAAEATEAGDNAPTLAQPSVDVEKAQAFVPFSIEIGQDWAGFQAEMASMLADAKDTLEESKFSLGAGHGSNVPEGVITGATTTVSTGATATVALSDVYAVADALPSRWKGRASWVANQAFYSKIKQLAIAAGGNVGVWADIAGGQPPRLNDKPAYEASSIVSTLTTSNSKVAAYGDFRQFLIVDRVGMSVELVPHLFATTNNRPSGQRGLYAYWRNSSKVLVPGAFRVMKVL